MAKPVGCGSYHRGGCPEESLLRSTHKEYSYETVALALGVEETVRLIQGRRDEPDIQESLRIFKES